MAKSNEAKAELYKETLIAGLWRENPVFRLLLGMCPTLAVSVTIDNGIVMSSIQFLMLVAIQ